MKTLSSPPAAFTTQPVEADKNWVRLPKQGGKLCGLTRSHLYSLYTAGIIRSVALCRPHHTRGVRLIFLPSLLRYLESLDKEQNGAAH
jgi:hypothetical protein